MRVAFTALGCKVNHYESEAAREAFLAAGHTAVPFSAGADAYIVHTCTVTEIADKKSRNLLHRAHRLNPSALVVAAGCFSQSSPEAAGAIDGVDLVLGTADPLSLVRLTEDAVRTRRHICAVSDVMQADAFAALSAVRDSRTRATLKIQDGCDNYCAYCIIPYVRGHVRSRPLASVQEELQKLAADGCPEVVLTGIHLNSYGRDLSGVSLSDVLRLADGMPGIRRIRLGSLEPVCIDEAFAADLAGAKKLCRQFHLSLQSGSDAVLRRMRRRYDAARFAQAVHLLRAQMPDCAITTDVIAGFAGETEAEHRETCRFLAEIGFSRVHVFPYSRRRGTDADRMEGHLPRALREARARELIAVGHTLEQAYLESQIGQTLEVLTESGGEGYSGNYIRVRTNRPEGHIGSFRITGIEDGVAVGKEIG